MTCGIMLLLITTELKNEELVARIVAMVRGKIALETPAGDKELDDLYADDSITRERKKDCKENQCNL